MKSFFNRLGKADHISLSHSLTLPPTFKRQSGLEKSVYGLFQVRMENDLLHVTSPELILSARPTVDLQAFIVSLHQHQGGSPKRC